jgi:hypothetical protein
MTCDNTKRRGVRDRDDGLLRNVDIFHNYYNRSATEKERVVVVLDGTTRFETLMYDSDGASYLLLVLIDVVCSIVVVLFG